MSRWSIIFAFGSAFLVGVSGSPAMAQHGQVDLDRGTRIQKASLPTCPIVDEPVNLAISVPTDDGPVYFCCQDCIPKFQKNPDKYAAKVAAQREALAHRTKVQVTCPVTKEPVDQKVFVESRGKKVYFCSKDCTGKYTRDPAKYDSALANSFTYQTKCPVHGRRHRPDGIHEALDGRDNLLLLSRMRQAAPGKP